MCNQLAPLKRDETEALMFMVKFKVGRNVSYDVNIVWHSGDDQMGRGGGGSRQSGLAPRRARRTDHGADLRISSFVSTTNGLTN